MSEVRFPLMKMIPVIVITWVLSLVTTLAIVYLAPSISPQVTTETIADEAIITTKLANGTVTSAKIKDGTITAQDLADGSIIAIKVADGAVTTAKLSDDSVLSSKILDATITEDDLADSAIVTIKLANGAVTTAKILDGTITTADLADGAVTSLKLAPSSIPFANTRNNLFTSTTSTTGVDLQDTNVTITLDRASNLLIILTVRVECDSAGSTVIFEPYGVSVNPSEILLSPATTSLQTYTYIFNSQSVAAGTYLVKIVWRVSSGTATAGQRTLTVIALPA